EATALSGHDPASLHSVFGSSNGDGAVVHDILEALSEPGRDVSPTQFHNSVHNAAAGYWTIGAGTRQPASCLGCHDSTWGLSLLKAAAEVQVEQVPVLLCVYDRPLPAPMSEKRATEGGFGAALVLTPEREPGSLAALSLRHDSAPADPAREVPRLEALRTVARGNAAARAMRLLESLARQQADRIEVGCLDGSIIIDVMPCSTAPAS
ncbi:MAG: beta-ketoacyl synthase chain length factor, partial [Janthinobacterium lividum]